MHAVSHPPASDRPRSIGAAFCLALLAACGGGGASNGGGQSCTLLVSSITKPRGPLGQPQVSLEVRFLTVSDTFLQDVGVSLDGISTVGQTPEGIGGGTNGTGQTLFVNTSLTGGAGGNVHLVQGSHPANALLPVLWLDLVPAFQAINVFTSLPGPGCVEFEQGGYFPPDQPLPAISNPAIDVAAPVDAAEIHTHLLSSAELTTVLDALLNDVRNKILQAPNVLVASGQRATFMVNNARPPLAEFTPAFQAAILAASPTATQADVGPTLDLTPEIQSGGQIVLRVHPGTLAASFPTFPTFPVLGLPSTVQTPIVGLRQAQTNVTVPDGGTVLIGGLKTLSGQTETDLPVLKDIPVLNALFRDGTHVQEKDMLMILITPRIVGAP